MKDIGTMLPSELRLKEIELTAIVANTKAAKELKAIQKEITNRKKIWRPEVMKIVQTTGKESGQFKTKFDSPIGWKHATKEQTAKIIDVVSFDIII
jgi:hypothetical protein|tara:strand:+ start:417 stop:704 length:288 start_codon:yes stop_codon:yes gene_type:complete